MKCDMCDKPAHFAQNTEKGIIRQCKECLHMTLQIESAVTIADMLDQPDFESQIVMKPCLHGGFHPHDFDDIEYPHTKNAGNCMPHRHCNGGTLQRQTKMRIYDLTLWLEDPIE